MFVNSVCRYTGFPVVFPWFSRNFFVHLKFRICHGRWVFCLKLIGIARASGQAMSTELGELQLGGHETPFGSAIATESSWLCCVIIVFTKLVSSASSTAACCQITVKHVLEDLHKEIAELRADPPHYVAGTRNITKLSAQEPPIIQVMQRTRFVLGLVTTVALHRHNMKMTGLGVFWDPQVSDIGELKNRGKIDSRWIFILYTSFGHITRDVFKLE